MNLLTVEVFSGSTITINLDECKLCTTQACIAACSIPYMGNILTLENNLPVFKVGPEAIRKGACTECLGCEFECILNGRGALKIDLPMPELDAWLKQEGGK